MGVHPHPHPARADFSIMMELECAPEIGHCHSVCTLWEKMCNPVQYLCLASRARTVLRRGLSARSLKNLTLWWSLILVKLHLYGDLLSLVILHLDGDLLSRVKHHLYGDPLSPVILHLWLVMTVKSLTLSSHPYLALNAWNIWILFFIIVFVAPACCCLRMSMIVY